MNTAAKLAAFAAVVAIAFAGAAAVGAVVGPIDTDDDGAAHDEPSHGPSDTGTATALPRGLAVAEAGHRLVLDATSADADAATSFGFTIVDDAARPVTAFDELHDRPLHLIVLSRNLVDYLHLHPTMDDGGHWSVELPRLDPGSYRVFADFQPSGAENLTLGADIAVAGDVTAVPLPRPELVATIDGYTVTMAGTPAVGDAELTFSVEQAGRLVQTEPYLGAAGHLVAIRTGDLAYLHVHPHDEASDANIPEVAFTGEFPSAGTYRLFFDFSHAGTVHTAAFTTTIGAGLVGDGHGNTMTTHDEGH